MKKLGLTLIILTLYFSAYSQIVTKAWRFSKGESQYAGIILQVDLDLPRTIDIATMDNARKMHVQLLTHNLNTYVGVLSIKGKSYACNVDISYVQKKVSSIIIYNSEESLLLIMGDLKTLNIDYGTK